MAYNTNPHLPYVRMDAVRLVRSGWSTREVSRHLGFSQSAIVQWVKRAPLDRRIRTIETKSSRPHHHPRELRQELVLKILEYRSRRNQCAMIIHHLLNQDGYAVSLSSVKRVLRRHGISKYSRWKKWHQYEARPLPEKPGMLIETDTIQERRQKERIYVYTLIDVCSRYAYASPTFTANTHESLKFVERARNVIPFPFETLQSDHGSEFSRWFTKRLGERGIVHRHSRVRTPNDNAHLERFNRTLQDECLHQIPWNIRVWRREIPEYLRYYNTERPHMGLEMKRPIDIVRKLSTRY